MGECFAQRPLALGRSAVEQLVVDAGQQTAQPTESDLCERQDARGLIAVRRERCGGHLLFFERVEERVGSIRGRVHTPPAPRRAQVADARESREGAVEGQDRARASIPESFSITLMSAWFPSRPPPSRCSAL